MAGITDIGYCREDFPVLSETMNGQPLAFLDTASSAQKPRAVIERMQDVMATHYANIHRGLYQLSQVTTQEYESVRGKVADFIGGKPNEVVFTRNTTESINLVASSWAKANLKAGDEIILSAMEHHANIVPWQLIKDIKIKVVPLMKDGSLDFEAFENLLSDRTKLVSIVHASNALGTINPVSKIVRKAKTFNADIKVLIDASQSIVHGGIDVAEIGADFVVFTGHKLYGPTGVGVLWGRAQILNSMPPYQGGGDMIESVSFEGTTFKDAPARFEAGTPAIAEVIGLGAAIDYVRTIGTQNIAAHEKNMLDALMSGLGKIDGLKYFGQTQDKVGIVSFVPEWAHPSDVTMILDKCGVAVRTGHHCCMPLMKHLGVEGTIRASIGLYSNQNDIDSLVVGLKKAKELLS